MLEVVFIINKALSLGLLLFHIPYHWLCKTVYFIRYLQWCQYLSATVGTGHLFAKKSPPTFALKFRYLGRSTTLSTIPSMDCLAGPQGLLKLLTWGLYLPNIITPAVWFCTRKKKKKNQQCRFPAQRLAGLWPRTYGWRAESVHHSNRCHRVFAGWSSLAISCKK